MKNITKWFLGLMIVIALVIGLEVTKFALLDPGPMNIQTHEGVGGPLPGAFHPDGPDMSEHPEFGHPPASMGLRFALADAITITVYVVVLIPLLNAAYQFGRRAFNLPRFNNAVKSSDHSDGVFPNTNENRSSDRHPDTDVTSSTLDEYAVVDNHLLDQLL
jgi:hypothetical protein